MVRGDSIEGYLSLLLPIAIDNFMRRWELIGDNG